MPCAPLTVSTLPPKKIVCATGSENIGIAPRPASGHRGVGLGKKAGGKATAVTTEVPFRTDFPNAVREIEHVWIPMPDGVRLSARIWMPEDAAANPVPAILEYIPYRKRDGV